MASYTSKPQLLLDLNQKMTMHRPPLTLLTPGDDIREQLQELRIRRLEDLVITLVEVLSQKNSHSGISPLSTPGINKLLSSVSVSNL
jgi:hypothetical protein